MGVVFGFVYVMAKLRRPGAAMPTAPVYPPPPGGHSPLGAPYVYPQQPAPQAYPPPAQHPQPYPQRQPAPAGLPAGRLRGLRHPDLTRSHAVPALRPSESPAPSAVTSRAAVGRYCTAAQERLARPLRDRRARASAAASIAARSSSLSLRREDAGTGRPLLERGAPGAALALGAAHGCAPPSSAAATRSSVLH